MKKMPAPAPKIEGVKPSAANPTLTWSRKFTA